MKCFFLFSIFLFQIIIVRSQLIDSTFQAKMNNIKQKTTGNRFDFITEFKVNGPMTESFKIEDAEILVLKKDLSNGGFFYDSIKFIEKGFMHSIGGITIEPRLNYILNTKSSVFIKAPINFSVSVTYLNSHNYLYSYGALNIGLPLLVGYGRNLNSASNHVSLKGFSISGGYNLLLGPLVGVKRNVEDETKWFYRDYRARRLWHYPIIGFDYYWVSKKNKVHGFSLLTSPNQFYLRLSFMIKSKGKFILVNPKQI
jgi:hypothetical protein